MDICWEVGWVADLLLGCLVNSTELQIQGLPFNRPYCVPRAFGVLFPNRQQPYAEGILISISQMQKLRPAEP